MRAFRFILRIKQFYILVSWRWFSLQIHGTGDIFLYMQTSFQFTFRFRNGLLYNA